MEPGDSAGWLRWVNPAIEKRLGRVRQVLFDFDGTISTLRQGWEEVMAPMMVAEITGQGGKAAVIEAEVQAYIDHSTGILTIRQMEWLAEAVARHGLNAPPRTPPAYKAMYLERLMVRVEERLARMVSGAAQPEDHSLAGAVHLVKGLAARGVTLYLASGTDHAFVVNEARALGLLDYFTGGVFGALDESDAHAKDKIIQEILERTNQVPGELLVVGDGSVEMREAAARGVPALGVASDEARRSGWNERKVPRLVKAGADLLVADFIHADELVALLCGIG